LGDTRRISKRGELPADALMELGSAIGDMMKQNFVAVTMGGERGKIGRWGNAKDDG